MPSPTSVITQAPPSNRTNLGWVKKNYPSRDFFLSASTILQRAVSRNWITFSFLVSLLHLSSSPTSHYPMMMLPSGQAVPVLPGPVQMPSVINVRQLSLNSTWSLLVFSSLQFIRICLCYLVFSWPDRCAWYPTFLESLVLLWEGAAVVPTPPPAIASTQRPRWSAPA